MKILLVTLAMGLAIGNGCGKKKAHPTTVLMLPSGLIPRWNNDTLWIEVDSALLERVIDSLYAQKTTQST